MQGQLINDRYQIVRQIGRGGMSSVFLAEDVRSGEQVALKIMAHAQLARMGMDEEDALREAWLMRQLKHPALPRIRDQLISGSDCVIVMDLVEGVTLEEHIRRRGRLSERQTCLLGIALCQVLSYLHARCPPVIYRDMKPENILIDRLYKIHLIDLGIACPEGTMMRAVGTRPYAPPEQCAGQRCDRRADIYALGKTLWRAAYGMEESGATRLQRILRRCMAPCVQERYPDCRHLAHDLRGCLRVRRCPLWIGASLSLAVMGALVCAGHDLGEMCPEHLFAQRMSEIRADGSFSVEEEAMLQREIMPLLARCQDAEMYARMSFQLGELYWSMDLENAQSGALQRMRRAVPWFVKAAAGHDKERAQAYVIMGTCYQRMAAGAPEEKEMRDMWNALLALLDPCQDDALLCLQLCGVLTVMAGEYGDMLQESLLLGIEKICAMLEDLSFADARALAQQEELTAYAHALRSAAYAAERKEK